MRSNHLYSGVCTIPLTCPRCKQDFRKSKEFDTHTKQCNDGDVVQPAVAGGGGDAIDEADDDFLPDDDFLTAAMEQEDRAPGSELRALFMDIGEFPEQ
jgi:hypothetical protein